MGPRDKQIRGLLRLQGLTLRQAVEPTPSDTTPPDNLLELDEELFSALGAQLGGDNESLRNLLLDANAKIGELDSIKNAVGKLVDPVSKALRAFEAEKSEKISLQTTLNNTRTAYGKLRNEVAELEKKAAFSEKECQALRQELATTQNLLHGLEATKAEIAIDVAARRAQIVDLEARLAQETGEGKALREENRRLDERLSGADKRVMALESELNGARQRLLMIEDEKRAQQISIDKISAPRPRESRASWPRRKPA
jgi:chromosome segregation ATPase